ncbi:ABC transporter ATP-binding protein [Mycolicibacterium sp. YH-1]|nr:ABC transporter ATP-binding protein [Mycolicibacterium sp. YH-1]UNB55862.1 ABC transporter ATP-binding protein [Mycolicibacterium sp. YH-1]
MALAFGAHQAVRGISLDVEAGEFFALLGGSGCGKTTSLRMIGGFEQPDSGSITIDGADVTGIPPEKRPITTVFQSYALFPHLSVADNVGFGLRFLKLTKAERKGRIAEALELVAMSARAQAKPAKLSGGQQQRIALARALVLRPKVLLLDEPLGALDAKLRKTLQVELRRIQQEVGITFIHVTHDQEEALAMSDRVGVMRDGRLIQVGTPQEMYHSPIDAGVADFLGTSNILELEGDPHQIRVLGTVLDDTVSGSLSNWRAVIRPEQLRVLRGERAVGTGVSGIVAGSSFHGSSTQLTIDCGDYSLVVTHDSSGTVPVVGDDVVVSADRTAIKVIPLDATTDD